jgi:pimeloyl-ACP methyl ester carboxylesterase
MSDPAHQVWSQSAGIESGHFVALVHGSMDRSAGLLRLSRQLDRDHDVLRYDRRGYGRSARIGPPWTVEANVDDLAELIDLAAHPDRRVVVFGHSFGGNVALALAARRPELVRAVVVYETPLSWLEWWPGNSAGAAAMAADNSSDAAEAFMRRLVGDEVWERLPASKRRERRAEGAAMVAELADLRRVAPWSSDEIGVPVLALYGEHGRAHHRSAMRGLSEMIAGCRTEMIAGAGHAGPHTHAELVAGAIRPFVASLDQTDDGLTLPHAADG